MKSRPNTANDAITTVRVVARGHLRAWAGPCNPAAAPQGDREAKNDAFHDPVAHIAENIRTSIWLERAAVDADHADRHRNRRSRPRR